RLDPAAEHADPNLGFLDVLSRFHRVHGDQRAVPLVVLLDHGADLALQQLIDPCDAVAHGKDSRLEDARHKRRNGDATGSTEGLKSCALSLPVFRLVTASAGSSRACSTR